MSVKIGDRVKEEGHDHVLLVQQIERDRIGMSYEGSETVAVVASHEDFSRYFCVIGQATDPTATAAPPAK